MRSIDWKFSVELVGIAAIVLSLVFVGIQLQQDRELNQVSSFGSMQESANALSELVQEHSDVWVRGLKGEDLTDAETSIFSSMIRAVEARYMNFIIRWQAADSDLFDPEAHARGFAYYMYIYPGLRKHVMNQSRVFDLRSSAFEGSTTAPPILDMAMPYLQRLDENAPEIPADKTYIIW
jgi:hypothetical protein